jgi:ABC-type multidrug transport system fused ATPase/permease subunit
MEVVSTTTTTDPVNMYDYLNSFVMNPMVFVIIILIIVAYYVFSSSLGLGNNGNFSVSSSNYGSGSTIMGTIIILILIILILVNAFQYFFSINLTAYIKGLFMPETQVNLVVDNSSGKSKEEIKGELKEKIKDIKDVKENIRQDIREDIREDIEGHNEDIFSKIKLKKQVFNIPGNYYSYDNAKALCKAYDSELATYDQIENSYNKGAEWCNYGWSANQMALFPTQKQTYDTLQTIKGHENDCGRPGINGGYMANPRIRFGVNCYGQKPAITNKEEELMRTSTPYPETKEDKIFQKKVDFWKNNIDQILISPFNHNVWGAV